MNPNYDQTITVFMSGKGEWKRRVLENCFFKAATGTIASGNTLNSQNVYVARIPEQEIPLSFKTGDLIIKGAVKEVITDKSPNTATEILKKYQPNAFRVTSFSDNTNFPVDKHYRAGG